MSNLKIQYTKTIKFGVLIIFALKLTTVVVDHATSQS